ncbi:hypothetical protein BACCAP_04338 [Pseudoflavonifractor capillosus ATCC 29799]|uniref:Uncharacterized protein n=1 Tax=Pseudoflavonifractor capillosus ATCC 29799 TaxID=411467 RepID=A6P1H1_9FIRM|nr:hypothetical protein BACCAP_04338 [Pseudoflavonifractor capillosus ATCC 29799]
MEFLILYTKKQNMKNIKRYTRNTPKYCFLYVEKMQIKNVEDGSMTKIQNIIMSC